MTPEELYFAIKKEYARLKDAPETNDLPYILSSILKVHGMVHPKEVSLSPESTIADYVLNYMLKDDHKMKLVPRMDCEVDLNFAGTDMVPLCWHFWHTYRIEDLVSNILIADGKQVFDEEFRKRMNAPITDTGNALELEECIGFAQQINVDALKDYMLAVGKQTRRIVSELSLADLNRKPSKKQLDRIMEEGGLTSDRRSAWLIDFWGGLTVFEMALTPLTDHHMMHLPPCLNHLPIL